MALELLETNIVLDVYDHDGTRPSIKSIALDDNTRYVFARLTYQGETYDIWSTATVELIIIRPDKVGAQIVGESKAIQMGQEDESIVTVYGAYAELDQPAIAVAGTLLGQFVITSGDQILRSQIFAVNNGQALDADEWAGQYDGYNLDELDEKVDNAVERVDDIEEDVSELKSGFNDYAKGIENIGIRYAFVNGGMTNGQVMPSIKYRVATDEIITFDHDITLTVASGFRMGIHFFDSEGTYTKETGWRQGSYTINAGQGFKIVIARTTESGSEVANITEFTSKVTYESDTEYRLSQLEDTTDDLTAEVYKTLTPQITDTATGKYISTRGVIGTLSYGAYSTVIPVLKGDKLKLRCVANTSMSAISYCYDDLTHITPAVLGTSYNVTDYTLIADHTGYVVLSYYKDREHNLTINRSLHNETVLLEKQTIWCGDSIMLGNAFNDSKSGWSGRIADASRCMYKNYAEGGACITRGVSQTGKTAVIDQIENAYNDYPDADYIIFDGGCNDADLIGNATGETKPAQFGSFDANDFSGTYDTDTFCGAFETICMYLSQHWLGKHVGYIVPHKMGVSNNYHKGSNNYRTYYETAIQICEKWGIHVLNLWDGCYLNPKHTWMCDTNNTMTEEEIYDAGFLYADRQHLTSAGYDYETAIVMQWIQGL